MGTRLQVVLSESELDEIRAAAERRHSSVSEWVRSVLRAERERDRKGRSSSVREPAAADPGALGSDPGRVRVELDLREDLLVAVQDRFHLSTARAAVEFALRRAAVSPMSKDEALAMQGVGWEGDLDALRAGDS